MKTIFSIGMANRSPWLASAAEGLGLMDESDRDALLAQLKTKLGMASTIQALVDWSYVHDPYLKKYFGDDQGAFWIVWGALPPFQPTVEGVYKRLSESDPSFWTETSNNEQDALDTWLPGVQTAFELYQEHLASLPASTSPAAAPAKAPAPVMAVASGPTTTEYIVGGAIVVAIGAIAYTLL